MSNSSCAISAFMITMHKFDSLHKLRSHIEEGNRNVGNFLKEKENTELNANSFGTFVKEYEHLKGQEQSGSKFSERIFAYWIMRELEEGVTLTLHEKIEISPIAEGTSKGLEASVPKVIDYFINGKDNAGVFIELKKNIDNIEKDLYKFYLMKKSKYSDSNTVLLIWENEDHWKDRKSGNLSQYAILLEDAEYYRILDRHFYLSNTDTSKRRTDDITRRLEDQISKLKKFLKQSI